MENLRADSVGRPEKTSSTDAEFMERLQGDVDSYGCSADMDATSMILRCLSALQKIDTTPKRRAIMNTLYDAYACLQTRLEQLNIPTAEFEYRLGLAIGTFDGLACRTQECSVPSVDVTQIDEMYQLLKMRKAIELQRCRTQAGTEGIVTDDDWRRMATFSQQDRAEARKILSAIKRQ